MHWSVYCKILSRAHSLPLVHVCVSQVLMSTRGSESAWETWGGGRKTSVLDPLPSARTGPRKEVTHLSSRSSRPPLAAHCTGLGKAEDFSPEQMTHKPLQLSLCLAGQRSSRYGPACHPCQISSVPILAARQLYLFHLPNLFQFGASSGAGLAAFRTFFPSMFTTFLLLRSNKVQLFTANVDIPPLLEHIR